MLRLNKTMSIHFSSIYNFRKPSEKVPIYRYAALDHSSKEDIDKLLSYTNIAYRVDLRSPIEVLRSESKVPPPVRKTLLAKRITDTKVTQEDDAKMSLAASITTKLRPTDVFKVSRKKHKEHEKIVYHQTEIKQNREVEVYNVNFINLNYVDNVVWDRCTTKDKLKILYYIMTFQFETLVKFVSNILKQGGLEGSYYDFIDHSTESIFDALQIITESLENYNGGVGINCQFCKDRSGIIVALVKYITGDSLDDIVQDYHRSEEGLKDMLDHMVEQFEHQGLSKEFAMAPKYAMENTFRYIGNKYGSVEGYLDTIGFNATWRERLRNISNK